MIDTYSLKARVYPVIILFFPFIIIGISYSLQFESAFHLISSVGVVSVLTYLFSQLGRDQGKLKENELWNSWGGPPSVQILRLSNSIIDTHTKKRYHSRLLQLCAIEIRPSTDLEKNDIKAADEIYSTWTRFLIAKTRDTKVFNLLFKENTSYGFRRNLWALKPYAIFLLLFVCFGNYAFCIKEFGTTNPLMFHNAFWYSTYSLTLLLLLWLFVISKEWVKIPAFAYALRLFEAIDQIQ